MKKLITILLLFLAGRTWSQQTITYTPMTAAGYQYKYIKADSGLAIPFGDTATGRGTVRPGLLVCYSGDSLVYRWDGLRWVGIGSGGSGTIIFNGDSIDINTINNTICIYRQDTTICYVLQPSTGGDMDSLHLNYDSTYIYQYRNGVLRDSVFLIHTDFHVVPRHFEITRNYTGPYGVLLSATGLLDSVYASPFLTGYDYYRYADGTIDSLIAGGDIVTTDITWAVRDSLSAPQTGPFPPEGSIFLVGTSATGQFATHENQIATYDSVANTYSFQTASAGDLLSNAESGFISQLISGVWVRIGRAILHQFGDSYMGTWVGSRDNATTTIGTNGIPRVVVDKDDGGVRFDWPYSTFGVHMNISNGTKLGGNQYDSYISGGSTSYSDFNNGYSLVVGNAADKILNINASEFTVNPLTIFNTGWVLALSGMGTHRASPYTGLTYNGSSNGWSFSIKNQNGVQPLMISQDSKVLVGSQGILNSDTIPSSAFSVVDVTRASVPMPRMTTAQRNAIVMGIMSGTSSGGTGYTPGSYTGVSLTGGTGTGATANLTVNGSGTVSLLSLVNPGQGYIIGDVLTATGFGGGSGFTYTITKTTVYSGEMVFNLTDTVPQYYNGITWVDMSGGGGTPGTTSTMQETFDRSVSVADNPTINAHSNILFIDSTSQFIATAISGIDKAGVVVAPGQSQIQNTYNYDNPTSNVIAQLGANVTDTSTAELFMITNVTDYQGNIQNNSLTIKPTSSEFASGAGSRTKVVIKTPDTLLTTPTMMYVPDGDTIKVYPYSGGGGPGASGWELTGSTATAGSDYVGTDNNVSLQIGVNGVIKAKYDSINHYVFGGTASQLGLLEFNPTNLQGTQWISDGSIPYALRVIADGVNSGGLSVEGYVPTAGGVFSRSIKGRGTPTSPASAVAGDIIWGHGAQVVVSDLTIPGSIAGYHYVIKNNPTPSNMQTEQQYFVQNASGRRYSMFLRSAGGVDFFDSTTLTYNPVATGALRANGLIDHWNSDAVYGAVDGGILRTASTNKVARIGVPTYLSSGSTTNSLLFLGLNTATDNIEYLGGGSAAYYAVTQMNFYTAAALATVTGTLAMRINSAQSVLIGGGTTDDGSLYKLQVTGGASHTGTLADQKSAIKVTATLPGGTVSSFNAAQNMQITSINQTSNAYAFNMDLLAGATDAHIYAAGRFANAVAGTGAGAGTWGANANYGLLAISSATTAGANYGGSFNAINGTLSKALHATALTAKNNSTNIGIEALALNTGTTPINVAGYFGLQSTTPTYVSAAIIGDNGATTSPIQLWRDNGTVVGTVADGGAISTGTASAAVASAQVEIVSTTKGFLPPRMTATQASAISSPAEGLLVYVTNTNGTFLAKGWWGWDGAAWQKLNN